MFPHVSDDDGYQFWMHKQIQWNVSKCSDGGRNIRSCPPGQVTGNHYVVLFQYMKLGAEYLHYNHIKLDNLYNCFPRYKWYPKYIDLIT